MPDPVQIPNDLTLFHYTYSPYARRIVWYLQLRGIQYAQCVSSNRLFRPPLHSTQTADAYPRSNHPSCPAQTWSR